MNILETIIQHKRKEVAELKKGTSIKVLKTLPGYKASRPSFKTSLQNKTPAVIAEFKRKSPSKGIINEHARVEAVCAAYERAGAAAVSVLTDAFFAGEAADLRTAREETTIALLRKDFIVDEIQIHEAREMGASAILLIAAVLDKREIQHFTNVAHEAGLDVLLELHDPAEMEKISEKSDIIGINNRNLKSFEVDLQQSIDLARQLPEGVVKVAESGIDSPQTLATLYRKGFDAFLIGESFMKQADPGESARLFLEEAKQLIQQK